MSPSLSTTPSMGSDSLPPSPSSPNRHVAPLTLLQNPHMTHPKLWPSCGQRGGSMNCHGVVESVSPCRELAVQQPGRAVMEQSQPGTHQQPASTTPLPSPWEQTKTTLPSLPLKWRPPSPCGESFANKMERPSKQDGIIVDALQGLQFLEKLLSSNLDQRDKGNSEVHRTLFKTLIHLRKILALAPKVGSVPSGCPV